MSMERTTNQSVHFVPGEFEEKASIRLAGWARALGLGSAGRRRARSMQRCPLILIAAVGVGCSKGAVGAASAALPPCKVEAVEVLQDSSPRTVTVAGVTEPFRRSMPAVRLMAKVLEANFREGDRVDAGRALVRLDTRDFKARQRITRASGQAASASLSLAMESLRRARALYDGKAIPRSQLEAAELAVAQAEAAAQTATGTEDELAFNLDSATIRSPFSGLVVRKMTEVGNLTAPGQPLLILEDDARLRVVAPLGAELAAHLGPGVKLAVQTGGQRLPGTVESVVPSGDPRAPGLRVQVLVDNEDHRLRVGTLAVVEIPNGIGSSPSLLVPSSAVVKRGQLTSTFVAQSGIAQLRWLTVEDADENSVRVLSGLRPGERVIRAPDEACLADGRQVQENGQ